MSASVEPHEHTHPGPAIYLRVGLILFILTAAEVAVYELAYHHAGSGIGAVLHPIVIPILLLLSAVKFALVAMFYMHLKQDSKLFSGLFVFPILVAAFIIGALLTLFSYLYLLHPRPPA
jgi:cytochrome c oxidase subunit 4